MSEETVAHLVRDILRALPPGITLIAAAKGRSVEQVRAAIRAGITCVGHNYVQDAEPMIPLIPEPVQWHMIGHLQRNKVKIAVQLFDCIQAVDSLPLAEEIEKRCATVGKVLPVFIEVNSGREANKTGALPEAVEGLARQISVLPHLLLQGLMTMGPRSGDPEDARPYFRLTRQLFEQLAAAHIPNVEMRYLSMGMSNSYQVAIEEGANMVRLGTVLFGQ
jgi:pyridoxal phosphate enzyme (YggS family)